MQDRHLFWTASLIALAIWLAACSPQDGSSQPDTDALAQTAAAATLAARTPTPPEVVTTEPKLLIAESDVDGDDGNDVLRSSSESNQGRVVFLPGFNQADVADPVVFDEVIVFSVEVFDTRVGLVDGAGIERVSFEIVGDNGNGPVVYENQLYEPPYCVFGGSPTCVAWSFADHDNQWPNGNPIWAGLYLARIDIVPDDGPPTQWRWRFIVDGPGQPAPGPKSYAVWINRIRVQEGRYVADFGSAGFVPTLPGHHAHFFFDSVPPEEAGMPGKGPWQLYPASSGGLGTSPFTLYAVSDRPAGAKRMCVLVANPDHSVVPDSGNCVNLP